MKVFALVGKSGTGKSYQATNLCRQKHIESIIDDGLFIYRGNALAGKSAKREATKVGAVKRAIFTHEEHRSEVKEKIAEKKPKSILIIGTSVAMAERIAKQLEVGPIHEMIMIEDITTEGERKLAGKQRHQQGKHVVPVPTLQLKQQFSGYFMRPLNIFKKRGNRGGFSEKTVVRPTYSYLGEYIISGKVIGDIVKCTAENIDGIKSVSKVLPEKKEEILSILIVVVMDKDADLIKTAEILQEESMGIIEQMTAFSIKDIHVEVKAVA